MEQHVTESIHLSFIVIVCFMAEAFGQVIFYSYFTLLFLSNKCGWA